MLHLAHCVKCWRILKGTFRKPDFPIASIYIQVYLYQFNISPPNFAAGTGKPGEYERLLGNERHNYKMLYEKVRELGGIPMMIKSTEMSNTIPDEKVFYFFLLKKHNILIVKSMKSALFIVAVVGKLFTTAGQKRVIIFVSGRIHNSSKDTYWYDINPY